MGHSLQRWSCFQATVHEEQSSQQNKYNAVIPFGFPPTHGAIFVSTSASSLFSAAVCILESQSGAAAPLPLSHFCFCGRLRLIRWVLSAERRPPESAKQPPRKKINKYKSRRARQWVKRHRSSFEAVKHKPSTGTGLCYRCWVSNSPTMCPPVYLLASLSKRPNPAV